VAGSRSAFVPRAVAHAMSACVWRIRSSTACGYAPEARCAPTCGAPEPVAGVGRPAAGSDAANIDLMGDCRRPSEQLALPEDRRVERSRAESVFWQGACARGRTSPHWKCNCLSEINGACFRGQAAGGQSQNLRQSGRDLRQRDFPQVFATLDAGSNGDKAPSEPRM